ncbi:MAG: endonuclease III [Halanaerobiales bacterium]|nr:endonuclease III [Halanaerobiales bacterium]
MINSYFNIFLVDFPEGDDNLEKNIEEIIEYFEEKYPDPETALNYKTPFQLLIATIMSAQTTDVQVNKVNEELFKKYKTPSDFAKLNVEELQKEIQSIGLYKNKSKYIIETSKMILEDYNGEIPKSRKELTKLPGVGRKTANVVLANAFNQETIAVDTHVFRVANRLGLVHTSNRDQVEQDLMKVVPGDYWTKFHHWLIFHGREVCKARKPRCDECELSSYCEYYQNQIKEAN